jgi:hypothetical protein
MSDPSVSITHDAAAGRFQATIDGLPARLDYRLDGAVMLIHHTEVPARLEGRGIAAALTAAAFEHARREGLRVAPLCSYARAWARRHPEFADVLER